MDDATKHYPTRDEIRTAPDRPWEDVPTPELGEGWFLRVGTMSASARAHFEALAADATRAELPGILLACAALDPTTGARRFEDADAVWLNEKSWAWVARATPVAARLNGLQPGAVEQLAKN